MKTEMIRPLVHSMKVKHPAPACIALHMVFHIIHHQMQVSYIQRYTQPMATDDGIDQIKRIAQRLDAQQEGVDSRSLQQIDDAFLTLNQPDAHILGGNRPVPLGSEMKDVPEGLQNPGPFNDPADQIDRRGAHLFIP